MITIEKKGDAVLINGSYLVNRGAVSATVNGNRMVVQLSGQGPTGVFSDVFSEYRVDGQSFTSMEDLVNYLGDNVFYSGGGDGGMGSQIRSVTNETTEPLYEEQLDILYPDAVDRFLVSAPMVGSGMLYLKIITPDGDMWDSWPASRAIPNQMN